jgi:hypothetical protein
LGPGFAHIVKTKGEVNSTLNQNSHTTLTSLLCEGTENYRLKQTLIKEKFLSSSSDNLIELKKLDLFDLGILLIIAATGGLDVISEEIISQIG